VVALLLGVNGSRVSQAPAAATTSGEPPPPTSLALLSTGLHGCLDHHGPERRAREKGRRRHRNVGSARDHATKWRLGFLPVVFYHPRLRIGRLELFGASIGRCASVPTRTHRWPRRRGLFCGQEVVFYRADLGLSCVRGGRTYLFSILFGRPFVFTR
jgi:hypothetical protein